MILAYEIYFFQSSKGTFSLAKIAGFVGILCLLSVGIVYLYLDKSIFDILAAGYRIRDFTMVERLLTQSRVFFLS